MRHGHLHPPAPRLPDGVDLRLPWLPIIVGDEGHPRREMPQPVSGARCPCGSRRVRSIVGDELIERVCHDCLTVTASRIDTVKGVP